MLFWNISSRLISFMDSLTGDLQSLNLLHLVLQCNGNQLNLCQACYLWVHLCTIPDVFGMHKVLHCLQSPSGVLKPSCHWHQLASFDLATCNPSIAVVDSDLSLFSIFKFSVVFLPDVCIFLTIASWIKDPWLHLSSIAYVNTFFTSFTGTIHMFITLVWRFSTVERVRKAIGDRLIAPLIILSIIFPFWHITMHGCWMTPLQVLQF